MFYKDKEYKRMQEEEWLSAATEPYKFEFYEKCLELGTTTIPEYVIRDSMRISYNSRHNFSITLSQQNISDWIISIMSDIRLIEKSLIKSYPLFYIISHLETNDIVDISKPLPTFFLKPREINNIDKAVIVATTSLINSVRLKHVYEYGKKYSVTPYHAVINILAKDQNSCKDIKKRSVERHKEEWIMNRIHSIIKNDEWNIRSFDIVLNMIEWTRDHINDNSPYALMMLSKLKLLARSGDPIYSVD